MKKRIFALVLTLFLLCCMFPIAASAETVIHDIDFKNVVMPVAGETPVNRGELLDTAALTIYSGYPPTWCGLTGSSYIPITSGTPYVAGRTYYFRCVVSANPGYKFDPPLFMNASIYDAANNYIKINTVLIENHEHGVMVTLSLTCQEAKQVDDIDIKNVVLPVPGEKSDNSWAFVDPDALYMATTPTWCKTEGGKYVPLTLDETFEEGKIYYYRCVVNVKPGYKFNPMNL